VERRLHRTHRESFQEHPNRRPVRSRISRQDYVKQRSLDIYTFGYETLTYTLQNIENLNFNVRLHNEYYLPYIRRLECPPEMKSFSPEELNDMVKWGVHLMQLLALHELTPNTPTVTTTTTTPPPTVPITLSCNAKEYCFAMTGKHWNIPNDRVNIYLVQQIDRAMAVTSTHQHAWMGDSGSSCHFTNDDTGMFQWKHIKHPIQVSDGSTVYATKLGDIHLEVQQRNGTKCRIALENCKFIPNLATNLFLITQALSKGWKLGNQGWKLGNQGVQITLTKRGQHIKFDTPNSSSNHHDGDNDSRPKTYF
jgi:hypothetical protein